MSTLKTKFGQRLRQIRRYRDLTQEQLAEAITVSTEFISNMERGINAPSFKTLERLANALKIEAKDLFDFSEEK